MNVVIIIQMSYFSAHPVICSCTIAPSPKAQNIVLHHQMAQISGPLQLPAVLLIGTRLVLSEITSFPSLAAFFVMKPKSIDIFEDVMYPVS